MLAVVSLGGMGRGLFNMPYNVLVCNQFDRGICVGNFKGDFIIIRTWVSEGNSHGQFNNPGDIAVCEGDVYIVDSYILRIRTFG